MGGRPGRHHAAVLRRRRRYEVVVEGLYGQAAAQRSTVSDHRSEGDALEAARQECDRLRVIYGDGASSWRIRVVRDGETVEELIPEPTSARRRSVELLPPPPPEPAAQEETGEFPAPGAPPGEPADAPPEEPAPPAQAGGADEDQGPVPDWLIARFEESIERQRERTYGPSVRDDDAEPSAP